MFGGSLDQTNAALRAYVQEHGDRPWTADELAELARLRAQWTAAARRVRVQIRPASGPITGSAVVVAA